MHESSSWPPSNEDDGFVAAGFGVRVVASVIDAIVVGVFQLALLLVLSFISLNELAQVLSLLLDAGYCVYFWTNDGATPGKSLMGIRVIAVDGSTVSIGAAIVRYLGYFLSAIPFGLGYLWVIFDGDKQAWHDKLARTYVVRTR